MPNNHRISLNAVRAFTVAARHRSIALAGLEMGVTPSAVSHQIKKLELELGIRLFERGSNSIDLTGEGQRLFEDATAGIAMIERSVEALSRDANEIVIRISMSLAVRWLIPALEGFKRHYPAARVRVETAQLAKFALGSSADIAITYHRAGETGAAGELLAGDFSRPVASPRLLAASRYSRPGDIGRVPALKCSQNNWDWKLWATVSGLAGDTIAIAHDFDTDDAALHAAVAGLGMVLAPALITRPEIRSGALVELAGFEPVELGCYRLVMRPGHGRLVESFRNWLHAEISGAQAA